MYIHALQESGRYLGGVHNDAVPHRILSLTQMSRANIFLPINVNENILLISVWR